MGILLILVGVWVACLGLGAFVHWRYTLRTGYYKHNVASLRSDLMTAGVVAGLSLVVIAGSIWATLFFTTRSNVNGYVVFYDHNAQATQVAANEMTKALAPANGAVFVGQLFDAQNFKQIEQRYESLITYRNAVTHYNSRLQSHRYWQASFLVRGMWVRVPDRLQFLDLKVGG